MYVQMNSYMTCDTCVAKNLLKRVLDYGTCLENPINKVIMSPKESKRKVKLTKTFQRILPCN